MAKDKDIRNSKGNKKTVTEQSNKPDQPYGDLTTLNTSPERKQAEAALQLSESFLNSIIDQSPHATWISDDKGTLIRLNQACRDLLQISDKEVVGLYNVFEDNIVVEQGYLPLIRRVFEQGETVTFELTYDSGRLHLPVKHPVSLVLGVTVFSIRDARGKITNAVIQHIDITERKRMEEALKKSEEDAKQLAQENAIVAEIGRIISSSLDIDEIYGRFAEKAREIIYFDGITISTVNIKDDTHTMRYNLGMKIPGRQIGDVIPLAGTFFKRAMRTRSGQIFNKVGDDEEILRQYPGLLYNLKAGVQSLLQIPLISKDEVIGILHFRSLKPNFYTEKDIKLGEKIGNQIAGAIANAQLFMERKRAEEERIKLEAKMQEGQKLESLGVLAGGIAHDFNNLLMAILGNADLTLHSLPLSSPSRTYLEEIIRASHLAADLCRQMLAYSGKGRYIVSRCDISELVQEMSRMLKISISKKVELRYALANDLPPVEADATQIRQVVLNLITNASEALGEANGVIAVSAGVRDCNQAFLSDSYLNENIPEGRYVYLEVSDTGCGMGRETLNRIFEPFFSTKFTGRGLGLAAVLGIVRGHKGAIKVFSEQGKGTTFTVLLPAAAGTRDEQKPVLERKALLRARGTILLVDDDRSVCTVGSAMLESLGFQSLCAANGRGALEVFRTCGNKIVCVILDQTMPDMSGEEILGEMRKMRSDVRVILSSGYDEQTVTQHFVGKEFSGFIQKPYTLAKLQDVLNNVFS